MCLYIYIYLYYKWWAAVCIYIYFLTYGSQKLAFSAAIVCMKVDYSLRMHQIEALLQI